MPKLSHDTLFARALPLAIADRLGLADAYPRESEHWKAARAEAEAMRKLEGRKLSQLDDAAQKVAFAVFICADGARQSSRRFSRTANPLDWWNFSQARLATHVTKSA